MPVIVWIHGGSFRSGQAVEYLPGRFMEEDVVLVAIQYRLGPLGSHWLFLLNIYFLNTLFVSYRFSDIRYG